jgi:GTP-binding protein
MTKEIGIRQDLRNIAIVAHVDHGKTTLVDKMLIQTGAISSRGEVKDRIMDSNDLEKEKGITILAKHTSVVYNNTTITIVDTPGHADFGGEVERGLTMVDGVLLLVDASEGPLPQTRFVLRKALQQHLPVIVVINKVDREDARITEVVNEVEELFLDLGADENQILFPILYCSARNGWCSKDKNSTGSDLTPLFEEILDTIPPPHFEPDKKFQALVTNLDASLYLGRLALIRIKNGYVKKGSSVAWLKIDGTNQTVKISELYTTKGLERISTDTAGPGEIAAVAGIEDITIGETLADLDFPEPLPAISVDEPSLAMTLGINTSPFSGRDGSKLTSRILKDRLDQETIGNVSIQVLTTDKPETFEVRGRGELQLAVLIETMRREGFEMTVGKPTVITKEINGVTCEPIEKLTIDVPETYLGIVSQLLALRKGTLKEMTNHGSGWIRLDYKIPARGLIGLRNEFLTETRGTGVLNHIFDGYEPYVGDLKIKRNGSLISDRQGIATSYALLSLQERGVIFISAGTEVYEGMIIGENARTESMDVNPTKEKKLTNMRSSTSEVFEKLTPPTILNLEQALEFISEDECVEVTPKNVRIRKVVLNAQQRSKNRVR